MCKYKDIFGKPGTGIHKYRWNKTAIVDYLGTIMFSMIISKVCDKPLVLTTIVCFIIGELFHYIFCIDTQAIKFLGMKN